MKLPADPYTKYLTVSGLTVFALFADSDVNCSKADSSPAPTPTPPIQQQVGNRHRREWLLRLEPVAYTANQDTDAIELYFDQTRRDGKHQAQRSACKW